MWLEAKDHVNHLMLCLVVKKLVTLQLIKETIPLALEAEAPWTEVERVKLVQVRVGTIICHSYSCLSAPPCRLERWSSERFYGQTISN